MYIEINPDNIDIRKIKQVVSVLKDGGIIIYPTDTVYGLGCDIYNKNAVEKICRIKGVKPEKMNFSMICEDLSHISEYTKTIDNSVFRLMKRALPGPYTFILDANNNIPKLFKNNKKTIGIRVPDSMIVNSLIENLGNPMLSTSIHHEDEILDYITEPYEIYERFKHQVDIVIDGGIGGIVPSTIIDCSKNEISVLREGLGSLDIL
ncbi:MAG: threonylcarbamoyl-AMP synthase [Sphingobacteriales bacterium]|jgi:tRNA threonylcarbamoyl adenosine modification protein (Sua5/YciO/YrdC/YwlC family)|nr:MAG: threonylcarbamoyl-AMP synthase [Sphingobacteriales bacterium]